MARVIASAAWTLILQSPIVLLLKLLFSGYQGPWNVLTLLFTHGSILNFFLIPLCVSGLAFVNLKLYTGMYKLKLICWNYYHQGLFFMHSWTHDLSDKMGNAERLFQPSLHDDFVCIWNSWWSSYELLLQCYLTIFRSIKCQVCYKVTNNGIMCMIKLIKANFKVSPSQKWDVSEWSSFVWGSIRRLDWIERELWLFFLWKKTYQATPHLSKHQSCGLVKGTPTAKILSFSYCKELSGIHNPLLVLWRKHTEPCSQSYTTGYWWASRFSIWSDQHFSGSSLHRHRVYLYFYFQTIESTFSVVPPKSM